MGLLPLGALVAPNVNGVLPDGAEGWVELFVLFAPNVKVLEAAAGVEFVWAPPKLNGVEAGAAGLFCAPNVKGVD